MLRGLRGVFLFLRRSLLSRVFIFFPLPSYGPALGAREDGIWEVGMKSRKAELKVAGPPRHSLPIQVGFFFSLSIRVKKRFVEERAIYFS